MKKTFYLLSVAFDIFLIFFVGCLKAGGPGTRLVNSDHLAGGGWFPSGAAPPSWLVASWDIDPQNVSTVASNNNPCTSALPCLTYNGSVAARWGTYSPVLPQVTIVTFHSAHNDATDPIIAHPATTNGAYLQFTTVLPVVATGTMSGVVALNRSTQAQWQATFPGTGTSCFPCLMQDNTTGYVAWLWNYGGSSGVFNTLSLLGAASTTAIGHILGNAVPQGTLTNGDSFTVYGAPLAINYVDLEPMNASNNVGNTGGPSLVVYRSGVWGGNTPSSVTFGQGTLFAESWIGTGTKVRQFNNVNQAGGWVQNPDGYDGFTQEIYNSMLFGSVWVEGLKGFPIVYGDAGGTFLMMGGTIDVGVGSVRLSNVNFQQDVYLWDAPHGAFLFDNALLGGVFIANGSAVYCFGPCSVDYDITRGAGNVVWGTGIVQTGHQGYVRYRSDTSAVNTFLQTGGMKLFDSTTGCSFIAGTPAIVNCSVPLTPLALDGSAGSSGFGGLAYYPGKGMFIKETP